jgi:uncharacterized protein
VIVFDTGPIYAAYDRDDKYHDSCVDLITSTLSRSRCIVPTPVISEACYLVSQMGLTAEDRANNEADMLAGITRSFEVVALTTDDYRRAEQLIRQYADMNLGLTDAAVVAVAERLKATRIATVDHRHFRAIRPTHIPAFELLP